VVMHDTFMRRARAYPEFRLTFNFRKPKCPWWNMAYDFMIPTHPIKKLRFICSKVLNLSRYAWSS